jgi:acyl-CoA thioesterase I
VTLRRISRFNRLRVGLIVGCVAAAASAVASCSQEATAQAGAAATTAVASAGPTPAARPRGYSSPAGHRANGTGIVQIRLLAAGDPFGRCEQRIEGGPRDLPTMALVGASYTAGVGPNNPALSWAADFARKLRWNAVIDGVSGAGYVRTGTHNLGPMTRMLGVERLPALAPSLVIVQAGHDDSGVQARVERRRVAATIDLIRAQAPHARIALLTVFAPPSVPVAAALYRTDTAIVAAAKAADPHVIIMDPLTGHWKFPHAHDGLHPTAAGDAWIARKVASILRTHGIVAARATAPTAVICDLGIRTKTVLAETSGLPGLSAYGAIGAIWCHRPRLLPVSSQVSP